MSVASSVNGMYSSIDWVQFEAKLPVGQDEESKAKRTLMYNQMGEREREALLTPAGDGREHVGKPSYYSLTLKWTADPNGNGYISLAELDKGIRDVLQMDKLFDCKVGDHLHGCGLQRIILTNPLSLLPPMYESSTQPAIMRAFQVGTNNRP